MASASIPAVLQSTLGVDDGSIKDLVKLDYSQLVQIVENVSKETTDGIRVSEKNPFSYPKSSIALPFHEETGVIQPALSQKTEVIQPAVSEETKPTGVIPISGETDLNNSIQARLDSSEKSIKDSVSSPCTKKAQSSPNGMIHLSAGPENSSERFPETAIQLSASEKVSHSPQVVVKSMDDFPDPQVSEEFKNGTQFVVSGPSFTGRVLASPVPPAEPIFPDFEMLRVSLLPDSTMESQKPLSPANYSPFPKDLPLKTSLTTLLSMILDWLNSGLDGAFKRLETANMADLVYHAEKELVYGLDGLKQMVKRIHILLRAVEALPNPPSNLLSGSNGQRNSIRDDLRDAGTKIQSRLDELEAEISKDYDSFVSVFRHDLKLNDGESEDNQLTAAALYIMSNSYVKVSEHYSSLELEIDDFRAKVRAYCSAIEKCL